MAFQMFHDLFPELAHAETRSAVIPPDMDIGLPPGNYAFLEMYCNDPGCDCRRVYFHVVCNFRAEPLAFISWGWEDLAFYRDWCKGMPKNHAKDLKGPILAPMQPTTPLSKPVLAFVKDVLLQDPAYVERLKRHYELFRKKSNPA